MNDDLLSPITDEQRADYERDGVVCIRNQFDGEWIDRMRIACERDMAASEGRVTEVANEDGDATFYSKVFMWRDDDDFRDYVFNSPAARIAAELMGVDAVRFYYDQLFIKTPGASAPTPWHHDLPYWPFRGNHIASVWLALTPVTQESSGVVYLAGSHKWGKFYRATTIDEDPRLTDPDLEVCPDFHREFDNPDYTFLCWDMEPGDVLVHHPLTVHGSGANRSSTRGRIGLSVRYMGGDAVWDPRQYVMIVEVSEHLEAGKFPADDTVFPPAWSRAMNEEGRI